MPIPTVDSIKKTASKKLREVTKTFLPFSLFGWKQLLVKIYHHHHQPVDHQSLTVFMNLPLLFHFWSLCICMWRGSYSEGLPLLPSYLIPLLVFSLQNPQLVKGIGLQRIYLFRRKWLEKLIFCNKFYENRWIWSCLYFSMFDYGGHHFVNLVT